MISEVMCFEGLRHLGARVEGSASRAWGVGILGYGAEGWVIRVKGLSG